jgi:hypothetical protein
MHKINTISIAYPKPTLFSKLKSGFKKRKKNPTPPDYLFLMVVIFGLLIGAHGAIEFVKPMAFNVLIDVIMVSSAKEVFTIYILILLLKVDVERYSFCYLGCGMSLICSYICVKFFINNIEQTIIIAKTIPTVIGVVFFEILLKFKN